MNEKEIYRILDDTNQMIQISDIHTYEMLYANKTALEFAKEAGKPFDGYKCYKYMMGIDEQCSFCPMKNMLDDKEEYITEVNNGCTAYIAKTKRIVWEGHDAFVEYATDNTAMSKVVNAYEKAKDEVLFEQKKMEIALSNSNITLWDYDTTSHVCRRQPNRQNPYGIPERITIEDIVKSGIIHPDYIDKYKMLYKKINDGSKFEHEKVRIKDMNGEFRWTRLSLKKVTDNNSENRVVGWGADITKEVLEQERLKEEIKHHEESDTEKLIAKARLNLTTNKIENYVAGDEVAIAFSGEDYDMGMSSLVHTALTIEQRMSLTNMLERQSAISNYNDGNKNMAVEYQRTLNDGRMLWVKTIFKMYQDSMTGNIMSFLYSYNIDNERIMRDIINHKNKNETDFLAIVYVESDILRIIRRDNNEVFSNTTNSQKYSEQVNIFIDGYITEEYKSEARETFSAENIVKHIKDDSTYNVSYEVMVNGQARHKRWEFYYLDDTKTIITINRTDVTELFEKQEQQRKVLESALLTAKQASNAKSNFLSRMSHEIRTPLNAILGMSTLAVQAMGNDDEVADCISKIGISGHYLLSLINDILDMSRIESGKMLLHCEDFRLDEMVANINTVIYGQADEKHIDYETIIDSNLEDSYIGDAMKLQQILVNILGNAVKFTQSGGKITFAIHAAKRNGNKTTVIFTINDTGCGIPETQISRIFGAFEQVDSSTTSEYGGTGLGLAISKNLAELMGGSIQCRSIVDVGTEFTVSVPLEMSEKVIEKKMKYSLDKLEALIVDDDIIVCENTSRTLKEMGMIPSWVCSGIEAIEVVRKYDETNRNFDFILIDWKMPEMDGIETARRIRQIVGPDVTIIIITAYDWAAIEQQAKMAGVNLCISKPMFKSVLVSAFNKAFAQAEEEKKKEVEYSFDGCNILLAEDHPLNAEIAAKLLSSKGCNVDIAENGQKAIEMFTSKEVNHYACILMDIRMPVMDGLQAALIIRRWSREDAKKIPIIAMTANAFDEDVEKCRMAGMDAHLAKPIEPQLMFHTINKFIDCREE